LEPFLVNIDRLLTPATPLFLELDRRKVAQRGVDALVHVDVVQEPAQLGHSISIALVLRQVNLLFFDCALQDLDVCHYGSVANRMVIVIVSG
jgi:hypothetical protein